jgi:folate-binding protein YgfZ
MDSEYRALREGSLLVETDDVLLELEGKDAFTFLHRMVANDLKALVVGQGRRTLLLDLKGHCVGDLSVLRVGDERSGGEKVAIVVARDGADAVESTFSKYGIADDFQIARSDARILTVQGPRAMDALPLPGPMKLERELDHVLIPVPVAAAAPGRAMMRIVRHDRTGRGGVDLVVAPGDLEAVRAAVRAERGSDAALDLVRLEAGRSRFGRDFGPDTIPQEARLEEKEEDALSFDKGCFFGQEVVARLRFRGHVNRLLVPLVLEGEAASGAPLMKDGKEVGRLTSVGRSPALGKTIALGFVRREHATPGVVLEAGAARAKVVSRAFTE